MEFDVPATTPENSSLGFSSGNFFYQKSTTGTTIAAIEANNDTYSLQKQMPLWHENFVNATLS